MLWVFFDTKCLEESNHNCNKNNNPFCFVRIVSTFIHITTRHAVMYCNASATLVVKLCFVSFEFLRELLLNYFGHPITHYYGFRESIRILSESIGNLFGIYLGFYSDSIGALLGFCSESIGNLLGIYWEPITCRKLWESIRNQLGIH